MASRKTVLRVVEPDEKAPVTGPKTIAEASEAGSTVDELRLMRARIARTLDDPNCPPRDLAALSRRLIEIGREIDAIVARESEDDPVAQVEDGKFSASAI